MYDPFVTALAALHRGARSVAAVYFPAGNDVGIPIRVIRVQPDETVPFGRSRLVEATNHFQVQISDAPALAKGERLAIGVDMFAFVGSAMRSTEGYAWVMGAELK